MITRRTFVTAAGALLAMPAIARWGVGRALAAAPIRVGVIPVIGAAPIFVVERRGLGARRRGSTSNFTTFESGPNMIQALASGTLDVYVAGVAPLAVARAKGIDVQGRRRHRRRGDGRRGRPQARRLVQGRRSTRRGVRPFHAKRAASPPASPRSRPARCRNTTLQHWLWEVAKADKADAEIVPMGIDATQQALLAGAVDGATIREPAVTIVQKRNPAIKIVALGGEMFPDQPGTVVAVSGDFLDKDPAAVAGLVNGVVKAIDLIKTDPPTRPRPHIEAALGKGIIDIATIQAALTSPAVEIRRRPRAIIEATKKMQAYQVSSARSTRNSARRPVRAELLQEGREG